jgi:3-methyl-2-oxobutanoate hydroxymethyltransferase
MAKLTFKDLLEGKGKHRMTYVQVAREEEAIAADAAGMDMISTAFIPERAHFARLANGTHFQFGLPWGKHANVTEALRDAMEASAQSVYCGMSPTVVEGLAREGVPVICHVGLVPPKATWTGGFRAVGKSPEQGLAVWPQVQDFERFGAFAVEMEVIPTNLSAEITKRTSMLTISLGSGADCNAQYLFSADLLGENRGHISRHAKIYRNFAAERDRLQTERIAAYGEYIQDVRNGIFPDARNVVAMADDDYREFLEAVEKSE